MEAESITTSFTKVTGGEIVIGPSNTTGVAWVDFDTDGDLDLFVAHYGGANFLYRNELGRHWRGQHVQRGSDLRWQAVVSGRQAGRRTRQSHRATGDAAPQARHSSAVVCEAR